MTVAAPMQTPATVAMGSVSPPARSGYRWLICFLLFSGLTINYIDRQILALLKPMLDGQFHWSNEQYGEINAAFQFAYALSLLGFGWFIDRFGTKLGYAISITAWSLAAAGHALVGSINGFFVARVALGLGEGGSFPSSIKTVALWFEQRERAFATSLFNAGSNVGALLAPAFVPVLAYHYGWHSPFIVAACAGAVWLVFWLALYRQPPANPPEITSAAAAETSASGGVESELLNAPKLSLASLLRHRQAWAFVAGKVLTDPVWWFFLGWLPDYFNKTHGLDLRKSWPHLVTIYAIVTVLSIVGGWAPRALIRSGMSPTKARKLVMFASACCAIPIVLATSVGVWNAAFLIGLAGAAHQSWSANLYTIVSDMFPARAVATVVGFGSMMGSLGAIIFPILTGKMLDHFTALGNVTHGYTILFIACGSAYMVGFLATHLLAPRFEQVMP